MLYLDDRQERLTPGMSIACVEKLPAGPTIAGYHFTTWKLPLTQDPLIVVGYSSGEACNGTTCDNFIQSGLFQTDDWSYLTD